MFTVYRALNKHNGKSYIGITSRTAKKRWQEHLSRARLGVRDNRICAAIRKYGEDAFDLQSLIQADTEEAVRSFETQFIKKYDTYKNGYNCNLGGAGFLVFPEEIRKKIGAAQKGKLIPLGTRRKMSEAKLGDPSCAKNFGAHTAKGKANPRAGRYLIRSPDGREEIVVGLRAFCRERGFNYPKFTSKGGTHGFSILSRFNDHPERE